jgi:NAD(P)H-hydrate epimerase
MKVITAEEMARIEQKAMQEGCSSEGFMREAALGISYLVEAFIAHRKLAPKILLLIGKGNKGGDGYTTGVFLLKRGFHISALPLYPKEECSPLCQKMMDEFLSAGGTLWKQEDFPSQGILLDAIFGTGFKGKVLDAPRALIEKANASGLPILSIDIPSGLNGNTGQVETVAIKATETYYLGLPKVGFFIDDGWNHIGALKKVDFGLPQTYQNEAKAFAYLLDEKEIRKKLPPIKRTQNKYERGYVLAISGSPQMMGAANLSCKAALRASAGIIRLFSPDFQHSNEILSDEIIREPFELDSFLQECKRASSVFIGPGLGRSEKIADLLNNVLSKIVLPCVIDADALVFFDSYKKKIKSQSVILTPHHGEFQRLIASKVEGLPLYLKAKEFTEENRITLVLKGAPTWIFHPSSTPLIIPRGDPGMATAGSGDVLTGILAALLAHHLSPPDAAALGVLLHSIAGEIAAAQKTSYSLIASDIIEALPQAFSQA